MSRTALVAAFVFSDLSGSVFEEFEEPGSKARGQQHFKQTRAHEQGPQANTCHMQRASGSFWLGFKLHRPMTHVGMVACVTQQLIVEGLQLEL